MHLIFMPKPFIFILISILLLAFITKRIHSTANKLAVVNTSYNSFGTNTIFDKQVNFIKKTALINKYSTSYCFLIDLEMPSGKNRFFIYDLKNNKIISSGLVAHGSCNTYFLDKVWFSNLPGCGCSSSGLYKIGNKYMGKFGKSYKLFGLEKTNSNALKRAIVLHSYTDIPDHEIYPNAIGNSLGCPMTSHKFFNVLSSYIDNSKKPILLYIF
jgi:hypothetical protein